MAITGMLYGKTFIGAFNKEIDLNDGNVKVMLTTADYTPAPNSHDYKDDVTNEVVGTGYTAGGQALTGISIVYLPANSYATTWVGTTGYAVGDIVRPTVGNGCLYMCIVAGTSAGAEPTWPTVSRQVVVDNTVTWAEVGRGMFTFDANDSVWTDSSITSRIAVVYYDTGVAATSRLILYQDFGENKSSDAGDFKIVWHAGGVVRIPVN